MPRPPRDWTRYSSIGVRFAKPPSVIVKTYCCCVASSSACGRITDIDSSAVAAAELHARDAGRRPTHRTQLAVVGAEADRLALARDQQDVVVGADELRADQLVVVARKLIAMTPA